MRLPIYQLDAFADRPFGGNPAAVIPLDAWLPDPLMQAVAAENNLSETAFLVAGAGSGGDYGLRWFTPAAEVDLCGHATLAAAAVVFHHLRPGTDTVAFGTRSGRLEVEAEADGRLSMRFPAWPRTEAAADPAVTAALGAAPTTLFHGPDWLAVFGSARAVADLRPDFRAVAALPTRGVICTAPADTPGVDFVSRFFGPSVGIDEDPVTGSAHCMLTPYWADRLGKTVLEAAQISARGGRLTCRLDGGRVVLTGRAIPYLEGTITVPD